MATTTGDEPLDYHWANNATEDWMKRSWPYVDEDGDDLTTIVEMRAYYPDENLIALLTLPVGKFMPEELRAEITAMANDPDETDYLRPPAPDPPESKEWVGL